MKLAFIKVFLHEKQRKTHSVTFDYLIASIRQSLDIDIKICYSLDELIKFKPDIVGISSATESYMEAKKLAKKVKNKIGSLIIIGGTHITALPETMSKEMDIGVIGEGEVTVVELLKHIEKYSMNYLEKVNGISFWNANRVKINKSRKPISMDELPIPIYPEIKYDFGKAMAILTTRGCVNKCVHCSEQRIWKPFRYLSARKIVEIIEAHYKKLGVKEYVFLDDLSVFNLKRLTELRDLLSKKNLLGKIKITKMTYNSELVTEDIVKISKELGLKLAGFGLESASPKVLKQIKGGRVKVENFIKCMQLFGKYGIRNGASTVWGFPGETLEDMELTKKFLLKYNGKNKFYSFMFYVCQPLPGSELWDKMLKEGKVSLDMDFSTLKIHPNLNSLDWFYSNPAVDRETFKNFLNNAKQEFHKIRRRR